MFSRHILIVNAETVHKSSKNFRIEVEGGQPDPANKDREDKIISAKAN